VDRLFFPVESISGRKRNRIGLETGKSLPFSGCVSAVWLAADFLLGFDDDMVFFS
jgi:hypothetical protein